VRLSRRVVCGTLAAVEHVLAASDWQSKTAVDRRVATLGEGGSRQQLALYHGDEHWVLPHASIRQPWAEPVRT
jgi:hypothetical protein